MSLIGAAVKYGLGFLCRSVLSFRRRRVEGEDILGFALCMRLELEFGVGNMFGGCIAPRDCWREKMTVVPVLQG